MFLRPREYIYEDYVQNHDYGWVCVCLKSRVMVLEMQILTDVADFTSF